MIYNGPPKHLTVNNIKFLIEKTLDKMDDRGHLSSSAKECEYCGYPVTFHDTKCSFCKKPTTWGRVYMACDNISQMGVVNS